MKSCLKEEKVILEYIPKNTIFRVKNSPAKDGMHEKSKRSLPCPVNVKTGLRKRFLTDDEIEYLGGQLGLDLSFGPDNKFWDDYRIALTLNTRHLNLSDPNDYLDWKALQEWPFIAKSPEEERINPTQYSWRLIRPSEVNKVKNKLAIDKSKAWMVFGENKNNKSILLYVYFVLTGKVLDHEISTDDLVGYFDDVIDKKAASFLFLMDSDTLEKKSLVYNAWITGVVTKKGDDFLYNGEKLAKDKEEATIENAAEYLSKPINQQLAFEIEAQYKNKLDQ